MHVCVCPQECGGQRTIYGSQFFSLYRVHLWVQTQMVDDKHLYMLSQLAVPPIHFIFKLRQCHFLEQPNPRVLFLMYNFLNPIKYNYVASLLPFLLPNSLPNL